MRGHPSHKAIFFLLQKGWPVNRETILLTIQVHVILVIRGQKFDDKIKALINLHFHCFISLCSSFLH